MGFKKVNSQCRPSHCCTQEIHYELFGSKLYIDGVDAPGGDGPSVSSYKPRPRQQQ